MPDSIAPPDEMADYIAWRETKWDYWTQKSQPGNWLTKIFMGHAEDARIQNELLDDRYRVEPTGSASSEPISDAELAELRASNPRFAKLPEAALKKRFAHKRK